MNGSGRKWPEGRSFAFTIIDDTDHATVANVRPVYELLDRLGLRITKTVWVYRAPEGGPWSDGEALEDPDYLAFVREISARGFEIALHGVRGVSSTRPMIDAGLQRFRDLLGEMPRIHINHSLNADNIYWGAARIPAWRRRLRLHGSLAAPTWGHVEGSEHFWGDLCRAHISYVRARCFRDLNTLKCDPHMPYHERRFPYVNAWFSCSDGSNAPLFKALLRPENQKRLVEEGGLAIVYAHFGKDGFLGHDGRVNPEVSDLLASIADRPGWFRPVSEVLDHLSGGRVPTLKAIQSLRLDLRQRLDALLGRDAS